QSKTLDSNDKQTICQAMKNSFADLGDIIRGRDLWTRNNEMQQLENNLKTIFEKIKNKSGISGKYDDDGGKYTKLREAWWSQNRDQVWTAMKCAKDGSNTIECDKRSGAGSPGGSGPGRSTAPRPRPRPPAGGGGGGSRFSTSGTIYTRGGTPTYR
ncbi:putative EMP1-like protein, partial [Plasmodium gaboni]